MNPTELMEPTVQNWRGGGGGGGVPATLVEQTSFRGDRFADGRPVP